MDGRTVLIFEFRCPSFLFASKLLSLLHIFIPGPELHGKERASGKFFRTDIWVDLLLLYCLLSGSDHHTGQADVLFFQFASPFC